MSFDHGGRRQEGARATGEAPSAAPGRSSLCQQLDAFPHAPVIQRSIGAAVPGSAVHDADACHDRGVPAFTDGAVTHFASASPSLHVAAHEAAHQYQHAGATHDAGLGAERHAHEVASAVTGGRDVGALFGRGGAAVAPAVRNYTEFSVADQTAKNQWKLGSDARVGDAGRTITGAGEQKECYADPALIADANAILKAKKSGLQMEAGPPGPSGDAPDGSGFRTTVKVIPKMASEDSGTNYTDCGRFSREIQGPGGTDKPSAGVFTEDNGAKTETTAKSSGGDPAPIRDEMYVKGGLGPDVATARAKYLTLTTKERDDFDKKHGLNKYAAPGVGESYAARRDDAFGLYGFNYHWAGVIMVAEPDRVTFQNYAKLGTTYGSKDDKFFFATYGSPTKPGQTFHEQWAQSGKVGAPAGNTMTVATRNSPDPSPWTKAAATMRTGELIKKYAAATEQGEKMALESEMRNRWIKVTVFVKKAQEDPDDVYVLAEHGGRSYKTGELKMKTGAKNTFWVPMSALAPVVDIVHIKVYDWDALSPDDVMSSLALGDAANTDSRPFDGAEYVTTAEFDR
jgi:hypothetical protein